MDLKETDILGDEISCHWYYQSKAKAMMRLLGEYQPSTILDIGAGSGFFSRYLLKNSPAHEAWCVDISYDTDSDTDEDGKAMHFRRSVDYVDADLVLLMDVLEHVEDDIVLLSHYADKVPKGAIFLVSVPAFPFLWSAHDVFLEHKRRYRLRQVEDVAKNAGLRVLQGSYYFGGVFPIAATMRMAERLASGSGQPRSQLAKHNPLINSVLASLCRVELPLMKFNRLAGLTAFCLAEKSG